VLGAFFVVAYPVGWLDVAGAEDVVCSSRPNMVERNFISLNLVATDAT